MYRQVTQMPKYIIATIQNVLAQEVIHLQVLTKKMHLHAVEVIVLESKLFIQ